MDGHHTRQYDNTHFQRVPQMISTGVSQGGTAVYSQRRSQAISPTSQSDLDAGESAAASDGYGYSQGHQFNPQMQNHTLQFPHGFGSEPGRQQFQTYPQNLLYSLPSGSSQSTDFESVSQFTPRQSTSVDALPNQFGVSQYFPQNDHTSRASQQSQSYATSDYQQATPYSQRTQVTSSTVSPQYISGVADYSSLSISAIMDPGEQSRQPKDARDQFADYYHNLRRTFREIRRGDLLQAAHELLQISEWISSRAIDMGLTRDDEVSQEERVDLWNNFNTCWLALLQKQKDSSQEMIDHGQPPPTGQTILQEDLLERMARELVRICDGMERYGLVDYQMGIWEEEIMNVLLECLQILEGDLEEYSASELSARRPQTAEVGGRASREAH